MKHIYVHHHFVYENIEDVIVKLLFYKVNRTVQIFLHRSFVFGPFKKHLDNFLDNM